MKPKKNQSTPINTIKTDRSNKNPLFCSIGVVAITSSSTRYYSGNYRKRTPNVDAVYNG